jgi:hypothetical protein
MSEAHDKTITSGEPSIDWCRRCNLTRTTVPLWALSADGVHKIGHRVDCGCYR